MELSDLYVVKRMKFGYVDRGVMSIPVMEVTYTRAGDTADIEETVNYAVNETFVTDMQNAVKEWTNNRGDTQHDLR